MKPSVPVARRSDYEIRDVSHADAVAFITAHHYAKGAANTSVARHGLFRANQLVGVAIWMPPTRACAATVNPDWKRVLSLSRLAVAPSEPQNAASMLIGASVRRIRHMMRPDGTMRWVALVTFADEFKGHTGAIYRATNWKEKGRTAPETRWEDPSGRQVARKATKSRTVGEMMARGYRMVGRFTKLKFTMDLEHHVVCR